MDVQLESITLDEKDVLRDRRFTTPVAIRMAGRAMVNGCIFDGPVELHLSPQSHVVGCHFLDADVTIVCSPLPEILPVRDCIFAAAPRIC